MKVGTKKYYTDKIDAYLSKKIKARGKCQKCFLVNEPMDPAHIITRKNKTLRFDEMNIMCLCITCHRWGHDNPKKFQTYVAYRHPKRWAYLVKRKNIITKRTAIDLKELWESLKK